MTAITNNVLVPDATTARFTGQAPEEVFDVTSLGKGLVITSQRKAPFSQELAKRFLNMADCPWERQLRNRHVEHLIGEMKRGTFRAEQAILASCECREDEKEYRVNGQHTCWARMEVAEKEYKPEPVNVLRYQAETQADLRQLYASFDRGTPRTRSNVIEAYLGGTEQFAGWPPTLVKHMASALALWLWESKHERVKHPPDDLAYLMQRDHAELISRVGGFCQLAPSVMGLNFMRRAAVFAAMLETFTKAHKASEEFWHAVKTGVGFPTINDPRRKLRDNLMSCSIKGDGGRSGIEKKETDGETLYRWSLAAWNAWRAGEELKNLRVTKTRQRAK